MPPKRVLRRAAEFCLLAYVFFHLWNDLSSTNISRIIGYPASDSYSPSQGHKSAFSPKLQDVPVEVESKCQEVPTDVTWTDKWPHVNWKRCNQKEFMDRGINSPDLKSKHDYPRTGIVSVPGHGNTWTRHLIEQATGLWTGSVFNDAALKIGGFQGESENCKLNSTVAIKAHDQATYGCTFERVVLVVRNPYFGSVAEFNRQRTGGGHVKSADVKHFNGHAWKKFVTETAQPYASDILDWITKYGQGAKMLSEDANPFLSDPKFWKNLLLVSYERLKRDPVQETGRIVKFLGLPAFRKHCVEMDTKGHFLRAGSRIPIQCFYKDQDIREVMRKAIDTLSETAKQRGAGNITCEFEFIDSTSNNECPF